jgi:hypothetical protein
MTLAPGDRHGNKFWLVRGRQDGQQIEISTKTTDRAQAEGVLRALQR